MKTLVQFAVNEECVNVGECGRYEEFLSPSNDKFDGGVWGRGGGNNGKPVFHIEYPAESTLLGGLGVGEYTLGGAGVRRVGEVERKKFCAQGSLGGVAGSRLFHTVLKMRKLDGWVCYCTGVTATTPTTEDSEGGGRFGGRGNFVDLKGPDAAMGKGRSVESNEVVKMDEWTRRIAEEDGYPFALGKGSEQFISDEELMDTSLWTS